MHMIVMDGIVGVSVAVVVCISHMGLQPWKEEAFRFPKTLSEFCP